MLFDLQGKRVRCWTSRGHHYLGHVRREDENFLLLDDERTGQSVLLRKDELDRVVEEA